MKFGKLNIKGITKTAKDKLKSQSTEFVRKNFTKKCNTCGKK